MNFPRLLLSLLTLVAGAAQASEIVQLTWDPPAIPQIIGHKVYFGQTSGTYDQVLDAGNAPVIAISNLTAGQRYYFAVTAYDSDAVESDLSQEVSVVVGTTPMQVGLAGLQSGEQLNGPRDISLGAAVTSPDFPVTKVEFFVDQRKIGEASAPPYSVSWQNMTAGNHAISAKAWDSTGSSSNSPSITVEIVQAKSYSLWRHDDGTAEFTIESAAGSMNVVYASSDLKTWVPIATFQNTTGATVLVDPDAAGAQQRFYRVQAK